jgi:hypothetical protein
MCKYSTLNAFYVMKITTRLSTIENAWPIPKELTIAVS